MIENTPILQKYILHPEKSLEYLVLLESVRSFSALDECLLPKRSPMVLAVYKMTGRGPFRMSDGNPGWEYEYQGVSIR